MRTTWGGTRFRRVATFGCCWWDISRASTLSGALPGVRQCRFESTKQRLIGLTSIRCVPREQATRGGADSRSLRSFLFLESHEASPDHSSLSRIQGRLPLEVYEQMFCFVLGLAEEHRLLANKTVAVDSTYLEANAAMTATGGSTRRWILPSSLSEKFALASEIDRHCRIVRQETGEDWKESVKRLAEAEGVEIQTDEDLRKYDKKRKHKRASNEEWESKTDPEGRMMKMKDGRTHLAYKAEHTVDLQSEFILDVSVYHANRADTQTLTQSLTSAQQNLEQAEVYRDIEEVAADKGSHANETLVACREWNVFGVRTYIPEPDSKYERVWSDKPPGYEAAYRANRRRVKGDRSQRLQKKRSELVERSFAHICETGGARRTWLRGLTKLNKRYKITAAARNLGLIMRKLFGIGKPRCLQGGLAFMYFLQFTRRTFRSDLSRSETPWAVTGPHQQNGQPLTTAI
ncbi:MAG: transposase [Planctomycetes bacterium]|nr:transposase [Planctomycetota bacterium]